MAEVIERYEGLAAQFGARVEATPADRWTAEAPCEGWTARDVVAHLVDSLRWVTAAVNGGEPTAMGPDEDPKEAWRTSFAEAMAAVRQPGALEKPVPGGAMGPMPLEVRLGRLLATDVQFLSFLGRRV